MIVSLHNIIDEVNRDVFLLKNLLITCMSDPNYRILAETKLFEIVQNHVDLLSRWEHFKDLSDGDLLIQLSGSIIHDERIHK